MIPSEWFEWKDAWIRAKFFADVREQEAESMRVYAMKCREMMDMIWMPNGETSGLRPE